MSNRDNANHGNKEVRDMIRRLASLSVLVFCLFSLAACVVAPVGPGYGYRAAWVPAHYNGWRWVPGHWV